jgi:prepilin-type N-terminal cleavage/methylation domain-containing protein
VSSRSTSRPAGDRGFTLIEVLVVVLTMGVIMTSLSMIVTTVLRTSPATEARDDDARTLLGLITYMPEDVNSTPPGGFDFGKGATSGCAGASPGVSLVLLTWTETKTSTQTFHANYRYADDGQGYKVVRYTCLDGQTPSITRMTSELPPIDETTWTPGSAPVAVTSHQEAGEDVGLTIRVTTVAGDSIDLEMRSNNPDETLPPASPHVYLEIPPTNQAPTAGNVSTTIQNYDPLDIGLPAADPDGDGVTISLRNFPSGDGWTSQINALNVTVTSPPAPTLLAAGTTITFQYDVIDPYGQLATGDVTLTVADLATNGAPIASDVTEVVAAGVPFILDLPVSDPDSDPLTVAQPNGHTSLNIVKTGATQLTITSDGTNTNPGPFNYTVSDGALSATATVQLTVTTCNVTSLTPATNSTERKNSGKLSNSVTYSVAYTGPCNNLVLEYDSDLSDGYQATYLSFGAGTTVTVQGHPGGHNNWTLGAHTMTLKDSQTGPALRTATLTVTE